MTRFHQFDDARVIQRGTSIRTLGRDVCQSEKDIRLSQSKRRLPDPLRFACDRRTQLAKQTALDLNDLLFGLKHFAFILLQLRRSKPLGVYERLLPFKIGRNQMQIGLGNLKVVAED